MDAIDSAEFRQSSSNTKPSFADTINILVVDDDATTLTIVSAMLKTWNYKVVPVKNPIDALATLREQKGAFDLVVTDLHMPEMDGFELQKHVRDEFMLPVIMMSADDNESVILKSLKGGVAYYIVKPVSKDDIKNVWQHAVAAKKGKSVVIGEIEGAPKEAPGESNSEISSDTSAEQHKKKAEAKTKKAKKRGREDDNEELMVAPKKPKVVWINSLHYQFLLAIRHIGFDRAVPKNILEFMNVPGLTRGNVASHLQKYRIFLKRVAEKDRLSKCLPERVFRSSFAVGHPGLLFNSTEAGDQYSQYLKLQQQMGASPINASAFQPSSAGIDGNTINLLGLIQCPNYQQSSRSSNTIRSMTQLIGSGQSRLLNHITQANLLRHQPWLGNVNHQLLSQVSRRPGDFGLQQLMNNLGSSGGMSSNAANITGLNPNNILTSNLNQMFPQGQQSILTNYNPFNYSFGTSGIQNNFTNQQLLGNFSGTRPNSRSEILGILNNLNGTGGLLSNGFNFNIETINGLTSGVRNVSLSGTTAPMATLGGSLSSSSSAGFETSTATSSAYQFPKVFNKNKEDQQQTVSVLPPQAENNDNNSTTAPTLMNKNNMYPEQELDKTLDDLMISNLFMDQQNNYQPPPSSQQQGGDQDQLPPDFSSFLYPVGVPDTIPNQMNRTAADQGLDTSANKVSDPSADQVPYPNSSGTYHVEENAPNEQSWSQVPNPNSSGPYNVEENAPNEQSWSQQLEGDQQVLNPEFRGNVFDPEDYNMLFETPLPFPDCDDDFLNAILDDGL